MVTVADPTRVDWSIPGGHTLETWSVWSDHTRNLVLSTIEMKCKPLNLVRWQLSTIPPRSRL